MELTQNQEDILQAAIKVIAHKGADCLNMTSMAKELDITEDELHTYFTSEEDLVKSIIDYFDAFTELIFAEIESSELEPLEKLHRLVVDRLRLFSVQRDLTMAMFAAEIFYFSADNGSQMKQVMVKNKEAIVSYLREAQEQVTVNPNLDPVQLFRLIVGSTKFLVTQWNLSGQKFDLLAEGEKLFQTIRKLIEVPQ